MPEHIVKVRVASDVEVARHLGPPPPAGDTVRYVVMRPVERFWWDAKMRVAVNSLGWRCEMLLKRQWSKAFRRWIW